MVLKNEKLSKKHHYLPRHYLKGFTDSKGEFFVYDKNTGNMFHTNPNATFFKKNLNTVINPDGKQSDFLEKLYAQVESQSWNSFNTIRKSSINDPISVLDRMNLFLFLLFLYWRLPSNTSLVEDLSKQFFRDDDVLNYAKLTTENGGAVPKGTIQELINLPAFKKSSRLLLPFAPFFKDQYWSKKLEGWRFLYFGDNNNWYITGDNPIITRGQNDLDPVNCLKEFIFPVSGKILLISGHTRLDQARSPEFTVQYGLAIIERAQRFVACQNQSFLEALLKCHTLYVQKKETHIIIKNLFAMVDENGFYNP